MSEDRMRQLFGSLRELPVEADAEFVEQLRGRVLDTATSHLGSSIEESHNYEEGPIMIVVETDDTTDQTTPDRRFPARLMVAAAVLLIVAVGAAFFVARDQEPMSTVAGPGSDESVERIDAAIQLAERFMVAYDRADRDGAMSLVGDGAPIQIGGQTVAPAEIGSLFELKAAIGERNELEGCEASRLTEPDAPVQVTCRAQFSNRWTDAVGGVPVDATYFLRIEGDEITAIRSGIDTETFGPMVWQPYLDFVHERNQGNDFGELFASNPDGIGIIGPKLTEQSVALHTRYTEDFEAARDSG